MEQIGTTLQSFGFTQNVTTCVTQSCETQNCASIKETQNCVNNICTQKDYIDKREYGLLLRTLEEWNTAYPKSICRIYGVKVVKRAIEYTKATPNVRNKGAYCLYMCRQLKQEEPKEITPKVEKVQTKEEEKQTPQKRLTALPVIENYSQASEFIWYYKNGTYEKTDNIISFANKIMKKYNVG